MLRLLLLVPLACLAGCSASEEASVDERPPNLVFVMVDDLGYGDLGSYGQAMIQTPRLDAMAAAGTRFTQFYAGSTVCAPSRSVLMTGRHTGRTYIRGNKEVQPMGQEPLPDSIRTLAEVLHDADYATALVGKWGLGGPGSPGVPQRQGFDRFYGYLGQRHAHNYYPEFLFYGDERVPLRNRLPEPKRGDGAGVAVEQVDYSHDLLADSALAFIDRQAASERPFFLLFTPTIPHANNEAGDAGMEVPDLGPYADEDWPAPAKGFAGMIHRLDRDMGRLLDRLEAHGLADNTIVFFTSDNGPHAEGGHDPTFFDSNGPLRGMKRDLYEGGIRVPMLAWGGGVPAGRTSEHIWAAWDVLPTLAGLAGAPIPEGVDGLDMAPLVLGTGEAPTHDALYWEFYRGHPANATQQAVRMGDWKAVRAPMYTGTVELYDLAADPGETTDVAAEHPDVVARAAAAMDAAHTPSQIWTVPAHNE